MGTKYTFNEHKDQMRPPSPTATCGDLIVIDRNRGREEYALVGQDEIIYLKPTQGWDSRDVLIKYPYRVIEEVSITFAVPDTLPRKGM